MCLRLSELSPLPPYQEESAKPHGFELKLSILFSALFLPNAIHLAFFPLWLASRGLDPVRISVLMTLPVFVRLLTTPLFTHLADRSSERAFVLILISGFSLLSAATLMLPLDYWGIMLAVTAVAAFWSPQVPIADSIALSGVRRHGLDYAAVRIWGSVFFLAASVLGGMLVQRLGAGAAIPLFMAGFAAVFVAALFTPRLGKRRNRPDTAAGTGNILRSPRVLLILAAAGLIQASHGFMYNFGSIFWQSLGISAQEVGFLWAIPVVSEILMFRLFKRLFGYWQPQSILLFTGAVSIARWILYTLAGQFGFGFFALAAIQCLHGFTFGVTYLAQQAFLAQAVPEEKAGAAQGLGVFIQGVIMLLTMFASGPLYAHFGGTGFLAMTLVSAAGIVTAFVLGVSQREQKRAKE